MCVSLISDSTAADLFDCSLAHDASELGLGFVQDATPHEHLIMVSTCDTLSTVNVLRERVHQSVAIAQSLRRRLDHFFIRSHVCDDRWFKCQGSLRSRVLVSQLIRFNSHGLRSLHPNCSRGSHVSIVVRVLIHTAENYRVTQSFLAWRLLLLHQGEHATRLCTFWIVLRLLHTHWRSSQ